MIIEKLHFIKYCCGCALFYKKSVLFCKSILLILLISNIVYGQTDACVNFREIVDNGDNIADSYRDDFDYGNKLFPNYYNQMLSETYLIKKKPDISIFKKDIVIIEIIKGSSDSKDLECYEVVINLSPTASSMFENYTTKMIKKKLAIEINGQILFTPVIVSKVTSEFIVTTCKIPIAEISKSLKQVCDNIVWIGMVPPLENSCDLPN